MTDKPSLYFCETGNLGPGERYQQDLHPYNEEGRIKKCEKYYPKDFIPHMRHTKRRLMAEGVVRKKYKRHISRKRKSRKSRKNRRKSKRHSRR